MDSMPQGFSGRRLPSAGSRDKVRLDQLLVDKGLAETREKAKALVMAGLVSVGGVRADKPGRPFPGDACVLVADAGCPYVSRGGLKLEAALRHFSPEVVGRTLLDVGASTGGFTDCLLRHGAGRVLAVDVGYGQLHWRLRNDPRVRLLERTNIRTLTQDAFEETVEGAVLDVSFISLRLVLPVVARLLTETAFLLPLIKPQFEVGKGQVGKGGVVRDPLLHRRVVEEIGEVIRTLGWLVQGTIPSPILGPKGNQEYLMYATRSPGSPS